MQLQCKCGGGNTMDASDFRGVVDEETLEKLEKK